MKGKLWLVIGLVALCALLSMQTYGQAHAQQRQDRQRGPDRLSSLTSYQGLEEMPRVAGGEPLPENLSPDTPAVNVPYSMIVFQSLRNLNDWNIFVMKGDVSNETQLTSDAAADVHPRLNRGCTRIAFTSKRTGNYEIYTMNPDGTGLAQLTQNSYDDVYPAWSFDGTMIAFQSYRDGDPEIYIMSADGTNQTRLTDSLGYDQMPVWSPDGRIAFSSERGGGYRIWVMNRDGSGLVQLSSQAYSMYPAWSPDGSQIAYSADNDGDDWLELWLMNADGSSQQQLLDLPYQKDAWVRSWSPGGQYIAFTEISFIYYQEQWYWTDASLYAWDSRTEVESRIIYRELEWHPDWQTLDWLAPVSTMVPLPPLSPADIDVGWTANDEGISGVLNYDVQYKDGIGGGWTDWWMATGATGSRYTGIGGHTYYFRVRARDKAGNVESWPANYDAFTMVEPYAPVTQVEPLPPYTRNTDIYVRWSGDDPGGSGIANYDVQIRDLASGENWKDWITKTQSTDSFFTSTPGHTYQFRSRATDAAQNIESWPPGDGDTQTTFYTWMVTGTLQDNRGMPIADGLVSTNPPAFLTTPSTDRGYYAAVVAPAANNYSVSWGKNGYLTLPSTNISGQKDAQVNIALPPSDNILENWGFERGDLQGWGAGGTITPSIDISTYHTGGYSALLGNQPPPETPVKISSNNQGPQIANGLNGVLHVVWLSNAHIYYIQKDNHGIWSSPLNISSASNYAYSPKMVVDANDNVHVIWLGMDDSNNRKISYTRRKNDGTWSATQILSPDWGEKGFPRLNVDPTGLAYAAWWTWTPQPGVLFTKQDASGSWLTPELIPGSEGLIGDPELIADAAGSAHIVWGAVDLYYAHRSSSGVWSNAQSITPGTYYTSAPALVMDNTGIIHVIWNGSMGNDNMVYYAKRATNGSWSSPLKISPSLFSNTSPNLALDGNGTLHVSFSDGWNVYYTRRERNRSWTDAKTITYGTSVSISKMKVSDSGVVYIIWTDWQNTSPDIFYVTGDGYAWSSAESLLPSPTTASDTDLAIDGNGNAHILWVESDYSSAYTYYVEKTVSSLTGSSSLSQTFQMPLTLTTPTLSFLYKLDGASLIGGNNFSVFLSDDLTTTTLFSTSVNTPGWTHAWFDLTPWLSQTITLTFNVHETEGYPYAWAYLDEVTVGSAHPDAWVSLLGRRAALPGDQVALRLTYGNRSPAVEALSSTITATLPSGLVFANASLTPTLDGNVLTWSAGDLPPGSGPSTIWITATVADDAALGSTLTLPVEIASLTPELEQANNRYEYALFIGRMLFLPLIGR